MKNELQELLDTQLSDLRWNQAKSEDLIRKTRGEIKVKKKLSLSLVIVMILILLTATALALYAIQRSPAADATLQARQALTDKYGLSAEAFGLFNATATQAGDRWVVTFTSNDNIPASLLGEYTVTLDAAGKSVTTVWSHDDVEPSLWQNGDVNAKAWGQPQIEKALRGDQEAYAVQVSVYRLQVTAVPVTPNPTPAVSVKPGQSLWNGEIITPTTPPRDALSEEQALEITKQAIMEEYGVPQTIMEKAEIVDSGYFITQSGGDLWMINLYFVYNEVEWGCGVSMNGKTGEILYIRSVTGGNG